MPRKTHRPEAKRVFNSRDSRASAVAQRGVKTSEGEFLEVYREKIILGIGRAVTKDSIFDLGHANEALHGKLFSQSALMYTSKKDEMYGLPYPDNPDQFISDVLAKCSAELPDATKQVTCAVQRLNRKFFPGFTGGTLLVEFRDKRVSGSSNECVLTNESIAIDDMYPGRRSYISHLRENAKSFVVPPIFGVGVARIPNPSELDSIPSLEEYMPQTISLGPLELLADYIKH